MEESKNNVEKSAKKLPLKLIIILVIIVLIIVAVILFPKLSNNKKNSPPPEIITQARIEKIIDVNRLSTFEAIYNGIADVENAKKPEKIDYYVSYEATVKAGIDFDAVKPSVDNDKKIITISIPAVEINEVNVDITSLDYIFVNKDANTSTVSEKAYKKCIEDAETESEAEMEIYSIAEENAKNIITALIEPFVKQLDQEYKVEIITE